MTQDTIAGLRAWIREPDYAEDGFSLESVVAWINRRPVGAFECMASELATLRESLAKAEGERDIARAGRAEAERENKRLDRELAAALAGQTANVVRREEANAYGDAEHARAAALQSQVERLAGVLGEISDELNTYRGAAVEQVIDRIAEALASLKETPDV